MLKRKHLIFVRTFLFKVNFKVYQSIPCNLLRKNFKLKQSRKGKTSISYPQEKFSFFTEYQ